MTCADGPEPTWPQSDRRPCPGAAGGIETHFSPKASWFLPPVRRALQETAAACPPASCFPIILSARKHIRAGTSPRRILRQERSGLGGQCAWARHHIHMGMGCQQRQGLRTSTRTWWNLRHGRPTCSVTLRRSTQPRCPTCDYQLRNTATPICPVAANY
ncbi:hypothetical protein AAFF_G00391550 [Aldrovandia affinis]|uniref:Uncharacterized protein n=1 Tax=Aldrovandia affinis TaxID=143900 RepID=A0AAD7SDX8_9TELE|nr:hypothetical protein AAFF_G00391550 [Aldrovandia affinis]